MQIKDIDIDNFTNWLTVKGLSDRSVKEYIYYYNCLLEEEINQNNIIEVLTRKKFKNGICRAFITNLLFYLKTAVDSDEVKLLAAKISIPRITGRKRKPKIKVILFDELKLIESKMNQERDKLMLLISFYGGLRDSELCGQYAIKPFSFNWATWVRNPEESGKLNLVGKGKKERQVLIPASVMRRLYQYIRQVVSKNQTKEDNLFKICVRRWTEILYKASLKAIERRINPHILRHSCGTYLAILGFDAIQIRDYLGHVSVITTQIYIEIAQEFIQQKISVHWDKI